MQSALQQDARAPTDRRAGSTLFPECAAEGPRHRPASSPSADGTRTQRIIIETTHVDKPGSEAADAVTMFTTSRQKFRAPKPRSTTASCAGSITRRSCATSAVLTGERAFVEVGLTIPVDDVVSGRTHTTLTKWLPLSFIALQPTEGRSSHLQGRAHRP